MHLIGKPVGWSVLAVIAGMSTLGLAGLSFIADIAETHAKRLHHKEEHCCPGFCVRSTARLRP